MLKVHDHSRVDMCGVAPLNTLRICNNINLAVMKPTKMIEWMVLGVDLL